MYLKLSCALGISSFLPPHQLLRRSEPVCHRSQSSAAVPASSSLPLAELVSRSFPDRFSSSQVRCVRLDNAFRTGLQASQSVRPFVRYRSPKDSLSPADSSLLVTLWPQQLSVLSSPHVSHFYCMHPRSDAVLCLHR